MKGVIAVCLSELVTTQFGEDKWKEILRASGLDENLIVLHTADIEDSTVFTVIDSLCNVLGISKQQAYDAFGDYFVNVYAKRVYKAYFIGVKSAKEFIMKMDNIHDLVTKNVPGARPPRFDFEHLNENTIIVNYKSSRQMIDLYIGLVKGVGKYYNTPINILKMSEQRVELTF